MKLLLSIDGGGIKGVIPAAVLQSLEAYTGKLTRETVSFVAGTSTGALIASAVAAGVPAKDIVNIYLTRCKEIFSPGAPWNTVKRVVVGSMYDPKKVQNVLNTTLGAAKNWKLNDSPIDILITAKRVTDGKAWYFVRDHARNAKTTGNLGLIDCAVASAAAPTYFSPWPMGIGKMIDGGVGVTGNPVYQQVVEAFYFNDYRPEDTAVISLGTGFALENSNPKGLLGWLEWTLGELLESPEEQQTEIVRRHYPNMPVNRFDMQLSKSVSMDDAGAIPGLYELAKTFAAKIDWSKVL